GDVAGGVALRRAQRRVVQLELREALTGRELEIADDEVALALIRPRRLRRRRDDRAAEPQHHDQAHHDVPSLAGPAHATREIASFSTPFAMHQTEGRHAAIRSQPRPLVAPFRAGIRYLDGVLGERTMSEQRVALVTGAAGGIGRAMTSALLGDGHAVAAVDRDAAARDEPPKLAGQHGASERFDPLVADLPPPPAGEDRGAAAGKAFGGRDGLVDQA